MKLQDLKDMIEAMEAKQSAGDSLAADLTAATQKRAEALKAYRTARAVYEDAQENYKMAEAIEVKNGLDGKNAQERDADLTIKLESARAEVNGVKEAYDLAADALDLATDELKLARYHARLYEAARVDDKE